MWPVVGRFYIADSRADSLRVHRDSAGGFFPLKFGRAL